MNEQLSATAAEELKAWSEMMRSGILSASKFAEDQLPDVLKEIILYNRVVGGIAVLGGLLVFCVALKTLFKTVEEDRFNDSDCLRVTLSIIFGGFSFIVITINFSSAVQAFFAPKMLLLDYFIRMVR